ncbi:hypothetical protein [Streptomyces sp. MAR4 CNX-425]|uniref:hypothetical protein n=1 Tax=Streptomyces sp. MAR4 CNX-425 TaxID=3406343 RepID=UPI003B50FDE6
MTDLETHQPAADGTGGEPAASASTTEADAETGRDDDTADTAETADAVDTDGAVDTADTDKAPAPPTHRLLWAVGGTTLAVLAADLVSRGINAYEDIPSVRRMLNVDLEANLATWWNSTLLLAVTGVALVAALLSGRDSRPGRLSWLGFAAATALLSIDETVSLHERLGEVGKSWKETAGVALPSHAWVLPGAIVAVAGTVCAVLWARRLPRDLRWGLLGALGVYLGGALVVEAFNGWAHKNDYSLTLMLGTLVEEGLEMGACVVALAALGRYVVLERDPLTGRATIHLRSEHRERPERPRPPERPEPPKPSGNGGEASSADRSVSRSPVRPAA